MHSGSSLVSDAWLRPWPVCSRPSLAIVLLPGTAYAGPNEGDIFSAVNSARSSAGLPAYSYAGDLAAAARGQAERMAASGELYHNPNLASEVGGWSRIGENVAFAGDWRSAHDVLMNSPDHRAQILDSGYTQMGVGTAVEQTMARSGWRRSSGRRAALPHRRSGRLRRRSTSTRRSTTSTDLRRGRRLTAAPPQPTAEQILRQKHPRGPREGGRPAPRVVTGNDPIAAAFDFSTVMDTVSG